MIETLDDIIYYTDEMVEKVPQILDTTNFWMVRSKEGFFYHEFVNEKYIALGWNVFDKENILEIHTDEFYKQLLLENNYKEKMVGAVVNKCKRFIDEIQVGDIAMIVGKQEITFAEIGEYFEDMSLTVEKELQVYKCIENGKYYDVICPYKKRRKIKIISSIDIKLAPPMIYKCLVSNRHSLSSLNEYAEAILSCCYDVSFYDNRLIIKYHVGQPKDINPFDFSIFTLSVAGIMFDDNSKLTGRYNLNSEGDIVFYLLNEGKDIYVFLKENLLPLTLIYFAVFGGKFAGMEIPSFIDKLKGWASEFNYRKMKRRKEEAITKKMEAEANKATIEAEKEQFEFDELKKKAEEESNKWIENIIRVSKPLNIRLSDNNIIDVSAILQGADEGK